MKCHILCNVGHYVLWDVYALGFFCAGRSVMWAFSSVGCFVSGMFCVGMFRFGTLRVMGHFVLGHCMIGYFVCASIE
jgi:hypothetical protein